MKRRIFCTILGAAWGLLLAGAPSAVAAPGLYVVELADRPAVEAAAREMRAGRAARAGRGLPEWRRHVDGVRSRQAEVRRLAEERGAVLRGSVSIAANALFVEMDEEQAQALESLPGVRRVRPAREYRMTMDAALPLHRIREAWELAGGENRAGEGVKIAVIDSGVQASHPAFNPQGFQAPEGFPRTGSALDEPNTSAKIIVARSYVPLLRNWDPDPSAADHVGHGTAVAMIAAGVPHEGPMGWVSGVAPRAWIGNYRVFGTPGYNSTTNDAALLSALDDALADGMDVINLSLGVDISLRLEEDTLAQAVENAAAAGVVVVVSAGNNGPGWNSIATPATAPTALSVGASTNSRTFGWSVRFDQHDPVLAIPGNGPPPAEAVTGELADAFTVDETGLACNPLPDASFAGRIVLILRGTCTFETKLKNAKAAGASGALIQAREDDPEPITMAVGTADLPAMMISYGDGEQIRQWMREEGALAATMDFTFSRVQQTPGRLASFSARGPNVDLGIKPDLVATGTDMWIATQTLDSFGEMYDPSGYALVNGTSFSGPLVSGAAAVLKSARPSMDARALRSALVNTSAPAADPASAWVQKSGAGRLDLEAAVRTPLVSSDVSLSFGVAAPGAAPQGRSFTVTHLGETPETYFVRVERRRGAVAPAASAEQIELAPGQGAEVRLEWPEAAPDTGTAEGFVVFEAASSGAVLRVPYWLAVTRGEPAGFTVLDATTQARRGSFIRDAVIFRIVDENGAPVGDADVRAETLEGGTVFSVNNYDGDSPGVYSVTVRLGLLAGPNRFRIRAGAAELVVTINGI